MGDRRCLEPKDSWGCVWCERDQPNFNVASDPISKSYLRVVRSSFFLATMTDPCSHQLARSLAQIPGMLSPLVGAKGHITSQVKSQPRSSLLSRTYVPT